MPEQDGDKSQDPTPHRRQEAREKGQVAQSQDLNSAILLVVAVGFLMMAGSYLADFMARYTRGRLAIEVPANYGLGNFLAQWSADVSGLAWAILPMLGVMLLAAVLVNLAQVGFLFLPDKLAPDVKRINPLSGFSRIFSWQGTMRLVFGIFKVLVVAMVAFLHLYQERHQLMALFGLGAGQIAAYVCQVALWTGLKVGIALLILAILDYWFQYWRREQEIRMTHQEVKEEMKTMQGDPQVAARRRVVQRQLALNRLSSAVPKADVVVTNPTELAVALQYDTATMAAPVVVAKGAGVLAQRIRKLALENGIPIVERKPLAQALYREVAVNKPIPGQMYAAVAEVLAYVYQLKGKSPPGGQAG